MESQGLEAAVFGGEATMPLATPKLQTERRVCRFDPGSAPLARPHQSLK